MICHEAQAPETPCRFAAKCAEKDQRFMHAKHFRGEDCWRFVRYRAEAVYQPDEERAAITEEGRQAP